MLLNQNTERIKWELANYFRGKTNQYYLKSIAAAYLLYVNKTLSINVVEDESLNNIINVLTNDDERIFVFEMLNGFVVARDLKRWEGFEAEDLRDFILSYDEEDFGMETATPDSISNLVHRILEIKDGDTVIDCCSGIASFLMNSAQARPNATYVGVEINLWVATVASIKAKLSGYNISITKDNCFNYASLGYKYDKAFSNHPFNMRIRMLNDGSEIMEKLQSSVPELMKATSADWLFTYSCLNMLNEKGKAVAVMTLGSLWNTIDKPIREYFLKTKKIQSIITLPPKMFSNTAIPVALVVMSQECSEEIRFVDASKLCVEGRRQNTFSSENIDEIVRSVNEDSNISRTVSIEEIVRENCSFNPSQYLEKKVEIKDGVSFESLIKNITRGASCTAAELDKMTSKTPTDYQYLMLANIQGGVIEKDLPYINEIPEKMEKYCIKTGNIIMSKNGYPFKVAVADVPANRKVLASGNLFVIEVDEEKVNPYYLKAFFESELGIASLKSIVVGATIPNIGLSSLTKLMIPMVSKEDQDKIANQYLAVMDEIELLKRKVAKAENTLKTIFSFE